jgi:2-dehydropantoate 2-reductase
MDLGEVLSNGPRKHDLTSAVAEACAVANASGAEIDPAQIQTVLENSPPVMRSSMQKDVAAGRQLELDAIGGPIARGGERYEINVSTTVKLMAEVRAKTP